MSPAGPTMAPLAPRLPSNPTDISTFSSSLPLYPSAISFISNDVFTEFGGHQLPFYKQQQEFPISLLPELGSDTTFLVGGQLMKDTASNSFGLDRTWGAEFEQGLISTPQASLAETGLDGNLPCNSFLALLSSSFPPSSVGTLGSGAGKSKLNLGENWGLRNAASLTVDLSKGGLSIEDPTPCSYSFQYITSDPGFAERAAKFTSFNGQTCLDHLAPPILSTEVGKAYIGSGEQSMVATKSLPLCSRDSNGSSVSEILLRNNVPAADCEGPIAAKRERFTLTQMGRVCMNHSNEADGSVGQGDSSVTEQGSSFEELKQNQKCSRKSSNDSSILAKNGNCKDSKATFSSEPKAKRLKSQRSTKQFEQKLNTELHKANNSDNAVGEEGQKPQEAPKPQYVHVRARRGEATDSHSLAERVRREKISERLKFLQELVPTCNKVNGKAGMLDEIINYVQSLQHQVEFLSMKLAALSPASCLVNKEKLLKEGSESVIVFAAEGNSTTYPPYQPFHQSPLHVSGELDVNPVRSMESPHLGHRQTYWNNTLCQIDAIQMKLELS